MGEGTVEAEIISLFRANSDKPGRRQSRSNAPPLWSLGERFKNLRFELLLGLKPSHSGHLTPITYRSALSRPENRGERLEDPSTEVNTSVTGPGMSTTGAGGLKQGEQEKKGVAHDVALLGAQRRDLSRPTAPSCWSAVWYVFPSVPAEALLFLALVIAFGHLP